MELIPPKAGEPSMKKVLDDGKKRYIIGAHTMTSGPFIPLLNARR
jgi:hypothetical protein